MSTSLRQLLFSGVLFALPVCAYFVAYRPINTQIDQGKKENEHKRAMLAKLKEATAQTDDLVKESEQIRASIDALRAKLPTSKEMDNVLRQVSSIASKHTLDVPQFKKNSKTAPAGLAMEQPLDIEITGDFDGFYQFLLDIEQLPRITRLTDLQINRSDKVDGEMKTKFVLSVYYEGEGSTDQ